MLSPQSTSPLITSEEGNICPGDTEMLDGTCPPVQPRVHSELGGSGDPQAAACFRGCGGEPRGESARGSSDDLTWLHLTS